jgi:hypothetical protein
VRATCSCRGAVFLSEGVSEPHQAIIIHRWMTTSPRRVSLLLRVFGERWRCHAYWVSVEPLCRFLAIEGCTTGPDRSVAHPPIRSGSEASTPPPRPSLTEGCVLSRALAPFQGVTDACRARTGSVGLLQPFQRDHAFRGLVPYSVFLDTGSDESRLRHPVPPATFAPSGFRTLSTLCSPHGLPSLFHPGPALGVHPSRL